MLRLEVLLGPFRAWLEFNTQKITDLAKNAVAHDASQLALRVSDAQGSLEWYRTVRLQRSAGQGNVFQMSHGTAGPSPPFPPPPPAHVRPQQPALPYPPPHIIVFWRPQPQ